MPVKKKTLTTRSRKGAKSPAKKAKPTKKATVKKPKPSKKTLKKVKAKKVLISKKPKARKKIQIKKTKPATLVKTAPEIERTEKLRKFLLDLREKILSEAKIEIAKYMKGETKQIVETALDDGDWSVVDLAEDISLRQLSAHRETLMKIDEALRKIDQGTYGVCDECGEPITEERLRILPFAIYCRECQERKEVLEKIEKEYE